MASKSTGTPIRAPSQMSVVLMKRPVNSIMSAPVEDKSFQYSVGSQLHLSTPFFVWTVDAVMIWL